MLKARTTKRLSVVEKFGGQQLHKTPDRSTLPEENTYELESVRVTTFFSCSEYRLLPAEQPKGWAKNKSWNAVFGAPFHRLCRWA